MDRRKFLPLSAVPLLAQPPGRKYKTALIGSGWWGINILREAIASGECSVAGLADPDPAQIAVAQAEMGKLTADKPREYRDYP